jgi:DNA replication and repair protein RecF
LRVDRLSCLDFRNLASVNLRLDCDVAVFHGANGQGKTNLLEAVYLLANLKSFRNARRADLVRWGAERAHLKADATADGIQREFDVRLDRGGRRARVDGKDLRSLASYFDGIRAIAFTPEDPVMVRGGPAGRRAFMDRGVFLLRADHLDLVRRYARLLEHKNALLRRSDRTLGGPQVAVYDEQLAEVGATIVARRAEFIRRLTPSLQQVHEQLAGDGATLDVKYRACCEPDDAGDLLARIQARSNQEWDRSQALVGPHREELVLRLGGRNLRTFGSQGQVRSAALALKLALLSVVSESVADPPLFLLDDLGSELDPDRNRRLLELLCQRGGQILVATTTLRHVPLSAGDYRAFTVNEGQVVEDVRSFTPSAED